MRFDGVGQIYMVDSSTGDGIAINLGAGSCCKGFENIAKILAEVFDGKVTFKDVESDSGNIYTGMKVAFLDKDGNVLIETPLDGTNGKPDFIDTGYEKLIKFSGSKTGSDSSEAYICKVKVSLVGIDTDSNTAVEFDLGESDAPAKSPLAETIEGTTQKGVKVTLNRKFGFEISLRLA